MNERPILFRIFNRLGKFNLKRANRLRVVNSMEKEKYIELGIDKKIIDVAPVPVELDFWIEKPKQLFNFKKPTIGWAGRFVKVKNLPLLFEIASKINADLVLAGDYKTSYWNLKKLEN